jgi:hypothetical protein
LPFFILGEVSEVEEACVDFLTVPAVEDRLPFANFDGLCDFDGFCDFDLLEELPIFEDELLKTERSLVGFLLSRQRDDLLSVVGVPNEAGSGSWGSITSSRAIVEGLPWKLWKNR